jgi:2-polyprenyl-6-methoxyphenol hydroxylase-like FAD-dependent oxidoreductase
LHDILLGAAERAGAEIRLGVTVDKIHEDQDRVDVRLSTGELATFDLLAGFVGLRCLAGASAAAGLCARDGVLAGHWQQDGCDAAGRRHHVSVPYPS